MCWIVLFSICFHWDQYFPEFPIPHGFILELRKSEVAWDLRDRSETNNSITFWISTVVRGKDG